MAKWSDKERKTAIDFVIGKITEGESVRAIFLDYSDKLPDRSTFRKWIEEDSDLSAQYARAREERADLIFDEIIEISNESNADITISEKGYAVIVGEAVQRSRLKIDARKWVLSKMNPKKYGDKTEIDHKSSDGSMATPKADYSALTLEEKLALREIHKKLNPKDERA